MNRRRVLKQLGVATIGMAILRVHEALAAGRFGNAAGVYRIRGEVRVNGKPAQADQLIRTGDTIVTGRSSEVVYVIGQDAFLQRENSHVVFPEGDSEFLIRTLRVISGRILSVFDKGDKRLEVPHATIGIRGTGGYVWTQGDATYFCLCYGIAEIQPEAEPERLLRFETRHHDSPYWISPGHPEGILRSAPVIDHSDAELTLLENLVGRWPPFYVGSSDNLDTSGY